MFIFVVVGTLYIKDEIFLSYKIYIVEVPITPILLHNDISNLFFYIFANFS